ncbi:MAG TPA: metallophosphoesterase [Candidatus Faecisoma merdavium]|nr:metallophosphoesterase [Candidatus Faecisoma merdavium]
MKKFIIILVIIILILGLGLLYSRFIATSGLKVKEYKVVNNKITDSYHGLKIIHLSDIHYNSTINEKELNNIVDKVNEIKPDIVVLTGDLIDERLSYDKDIIINCLSKIEAKLGKFAVSGNHDIPLDDYNYIIKESGFTSLDNKYELIYSKTSEPIIISGIGYGDEDIGIKTEQYDKYISELKADDIKPIYSILLVHEPDTVDNLDLNKYDLVLAGHSHGGQVRIPFIGKLYTPEGAKKYYDEYYKINNTDLYISSGLGTSMYKFRLFNRPSFNFYRITNK